MINGSRMLTFDMSNSFQDGFLDLEAKTLEIKEDEGTFKILVRLHDDTPDV